VGRGLDPGVFAERKKSVGKKPRRFLKGEKTRGKGKRGLLRRATGEEGTLMQKG